MMFGQERRRIKHNFMVLLLCLICSIGFINCSEVTEYKYKFDLDESKVHNLSENFGIKVYNENFTGQVLDEFLIKEPQQIDNVVQIITKIHPQNSLNDSIPTEIDPNELLSAPQIDKVWIDSYTWPIKKNSLYYTLEMQENSADKQQRIVSAAYVPLNSQTQVQKILNDDLQIYVLLSTGEIKLISKNHQQLTTQKTYTYNNPQKNQKQIQWQDGQLFHKHGGLSLYMSQSFYFISLNEINNGKQKRTFYDLYKLSGVDTVLKVVQTHQLLIFTDTRCFKLNNNDPSDVISYSQLMQSFVGSQQQSFVDFTAFANTIYFLHQQLGVIAYSINDQQVKLLRIEHPQLAERIDVQNETIMVTYQIEEEQYVQEYHFIGEKGEFVVNKVYGYHSQEAVGNILLFEKEMIVSRGSEIIHGIHSLSRKLPYAFHKQSEVLESKSLTHEVIELRSIWSQGWRLPGYMIITEKFIELIQFQTHQGKDIQQKWISISSKTSGTMNFDIQFIGNLMYDNFLGTCKNSSFYPPEYCSLTKSVKLTINDRVNEEITSWWLWLLIAFGFYLIVWALIAIFCTYFSRKQNQFESLIESQRQRKRNSTTVEMSFQTGTLPTEHDQK